MYKFVKRFFDIILSIIAIIVGFIPSLIVSVIIIIESKGSPFYVDYRVGKKGTSIPVLKFRSMVKDADDIEKHLNDQQKKEWEIERKVTDDPRITNVGKFLRKYSMDEFPQFLNVLISQMSIVGPRAMTSKEIEYFGKDKDYLSSFKPGITGLWQTSERNEATFSDGTRQNIEITYCKSQSFWLDLKILFRTVYVVLIKSNGK